MTEIQNLRKQLKKQIDHADNKALKMVKAILEIEREDDFWVSLPDQVKADIEEAEKESERGEGISTAEVMKKYDKWFTK